MTLFDCGHPVFCGDDYCRHCGLPVEDDRDDGDPVYTIEVHAMKPPILHNDVWRLLLGSFWFSVVAACAWMLFDLWLRGK